MKTGKKILLSVLVVLLAVILILGVGIKLYGNQMLRSGIEKGSQKALKVQTRLEAINLKILGGEVDITGFEIDNPEGYENPTFLKLGHGFVSLDTGTLLKDTIVMKSIQLDTIEVVLEQKLGTNNLKQILGNLPKSEPAAKEEGGKNILVNELVIKDVKVRANLLPVPGMAKATRLTIPLKEIRLENIGSEEKVNMADLTRQILQAIAAGILEQGKDVLPTDMIGPIRDQIQQLGGEALKQVEGLINQGGTLGKEILNGGEDIGKSATDAIKGLNPFQKKEEE